MNGIEFTSMQADEPLTFCIYYANPYNQIITQFTYA